MAIGILRINWRYPVFLPLNPTYVYCAPEVARCGLTKAEAREKYGDVDVFTLNQGDVDRAVAEKD